MQDAEGTKNKEGKKAMPPTNVYLLWGTVHTIKMDVLFGVYQKKETCIEELKRQQNRVSVEAIEFHVEEVKVQ